MENCPECGSSDWRLASIIYQEGTAAIDTESQGSVKGIGVGTGGAGVGLGRQTLTTQGTQQTILASAVTPPEKPKPLEKRKTKKEFLKSQTTASVVFWTFLTFGAFHEGALLGIFVLFLGVYLYNDMHKNQDEQYSNYLKKYDESENKFNQETGKYNEWLNARICLRCGATFNKTGVVTGNISVQTS